MKAVSAPLLAHLQTGGPFCMTDLYTITLKSGVVLRWVDYDIDVVHPSNGFTYSSSGPALKRGNTRVIIGVEIDTLDLSIYPRPADFVNGIGLLSAARAGSFDGANIVLERAFLSAAQTVIGTIILFTGRFADVTLGRTEMQVRVNSDMESLSVQLPRNLYQAGCVHTLYDGGCTLSRAAWGVSGVVSNGSTRSVINCNLTRVNEWFSRGYILFNSGALSGNKYTIKQYLTGVLSLFGQVPVAPSSGDTFTAYPGCDKMQATCSGKFNNLPQFRGCPYIPVPVTSV